jgi:hypothetical protein
MGMTRKNPTTPSPARVPVPTQDLGCAVPTNNEPLVVTEPTVTNPKVEQVELLSLDVTGFKLKLSGRALLVLALGIATAMGGTIVIKLIF